MIYDGATLLQEMFSMYRRGQTYLVLAGLTPSVLAEMPHGH